MEISLKKNYGCTLVITADNVRIEEDIEERTYPKTDDGKIDFSGRVTRDISSAAIDQITSVLMDMIYWREKNYDSSELIKVLFEKLPDHVVSDLLSYLKKQWDEYDE